MAGSFLSDHNTNSTDFPTTPGAFQTSYHGSYDVFVARFNFSVNQNLSCTESYSCSGTVATFTTSGGNPCSAYTASSSWGDGSPPSPDTIAPNTSGGCTVTGTHTYAEEGTYTITTTITNPSTGATTSTSTATVADASLTGIPVTFSPQIFNSFSGKVASFVDHLAPGAACEPVNGGTLPGGREFTATITWGDGSTSTDTITGPYASASGACTYDVSSSHTYTAPGTYTVTVTVTDDGGSTVTITSTATVSTPASTSLAPGSSITVTAFNGSGYCGDPALVSLSAKTQNNAGVQSSSGTLTYKNGTVSIQVSPFSLPGTKILSVVRNASNSATVYAIANQNGTNVSVRMDVTASNINCGSTFKIQTSSGYTFGPSPVSAASVTSP